MSASDEPQARVPVPGIVRCAGCGQIVRPDEHFCSSRASNAPRREPTVERDAHGNVLTWAEAHDTFTDGAR